jgi:tetratricopeptide (TPR) repeat protein
MRNPAGERITLSNMGAVYYSLGEKEKALDYLNQALSIFKAVGDRTGEAITLNNIGLIYDSLGETQKALDHYNSVLAIKRALGDRVGEAVTLHRRRLRFGWREESARLLQQSPAHQESRSVLPAKLPS